MDGLDDDERRRLELRDERRFAARHQRQHHQRTRRETTPHRAASASAGDFETFVTPIFGHIGRDGAVRAARIHRPADVLSPRHEIQVDQRPPAGIGRLVERLLGLVRRPRPDPAQTVGNAVNVGVHADVPQALERQDQHEVGRLPSHARQRQQLLHRRRHPAAESLDEDLARRLHVAGFVPVEAHRVDQAFDLPHRQLRHRCEAFARPRTAASRRPGWWRPGSAPTAASQSGPGTDRLPGSLRSFRRRAVRVRRSPAPARA